jgi:acetyl-CoA carboxylase carboxyltransferase component
MKRRPRLRFLRDPAMRCAMFCIFFPNVCTQAYDVRKVIKALVDIDTWFELKPLFGRTASTGLARLGGRTVGIYCEQSHL